MKRFFVSLLALIMAASMCSGLDEPVYAEECKPAAEDLEFSTYRNVSFGGRLKAYTEGESQLSFEISREPDKGTVRLEEDGRFVYTPKENKRGRDSFRYRALDSEGRVSDEATVKIKIEKQKKALTYADMKGSGDEYTAVRLSELGIFTGEQIGGKYCFKPLQSISRGEFISMCMLLTDEKPFSGVISTGYKDDNDIPKWMKPYAATAAMCGVDRGIISEDGSVFAPEKELSITEAAAILDRVLNVKEATALSSVGDIDGNSVYACINLNFTGTPAHEENGGEGLTRAEAAKMLLKVYDIKENR